MAFTSVLEYIGKYIVIKWRTIKVALIFMDIDKHYIYIEYELNTQKSKTTL